MAQILAFKTRLARSTPVDSGQYGQDYAETDRNALDVSTLEKWLTEIREQPAWRLQCDIDADYYDGHQLSAEVLDKLAAKGFPTIKENLCRPTIDAVLGIEAKTRNDWIVRPEHEQWEDVARALSVKLKEAERESQADKACSDAYAAQIKVGIAWVEVSRDIVPNNYPYRVRYVHRREIAWDWRAREPDLSDARYLVRRQWFDEDVLIAMFPSHEKLIRMIGSQWSGWWDNVMTGQDTGLASAWEIERATSIDQYEFRDYLRKRLCLYEVWYRTWKSSPMLKLPDGRWVEYDRKNDLHVAAVAQGLVTPQVLPLPKMRLSYWIGPHRLVDVPSPYDHNRFPYVPFFGYREDRSGAPYGLIRNMRDQQDEINARKQKMMWLMSAKQVVIDADAVDDHETTRREIARGDAYIILNHNRRPNSKLEVIDNIALSEQQFRVYENAKKSLQDVAGVYQALLGKESAAESGIAINTLIEQGTTTLAEIFDNYRYARRLVGQLLLELVKQDIGNGETVVVGEGPQRREVTLNEEQVDELGTYLRNDVRRAGVQVVLDDVPSTPTFRQQQLVHLTEFTKGLPDQMRALIADFIIEATDLPQRRKIGERIRQHLGIQGERPPRTEEELQKAQAQQQEMARRANLMRRAEEADVRAKELEAEKIAKEIERLSTPDNAPIEEVQRQVEAIVAQARDRIQELEAKIAALESALRSKEREAATQADASIMRAKIAAAAKIAIARMEQQKNEAALDMGRKIEQLLAGFEQTVQQQMAELGKRIEKAEKTEAEAKPAVSIEPEKE